ncbi:MAG: hypothetical protein Q9160_005452 [Pyrenula sp. 1 TL-2023]
MAQQSRLTELAAQISSHTAKVEQHLMSKGLPQPSFLPDGPTNMRIDLPDIEKARFAAIGAAMEIQDLLQGPVALINPMMTPVSLEAIYRWDIPKHVPLDDEISFKDLADRVKLSEPNLRRILRFAMIAHRIFREPTIGFVAHSAASRLLLNDPDLFDHIGMFYDGHAQAFARGFALANNTKDTIFGYYKSRPLLRKRFANAMRAIALTSAPPIASLITGYAWSSLPQGSTVIDVGGSQGHVSIALAQAHPQLKFIVQDVAEVIDEAYATPLPAEVSDRITFQTQDFLTPQQTSGDVYLFKNVLHDWPDSYVVKILRNLVPALNPGAKVVICERPMPEPGTVPAIVEKRIRYVQTVAPVRILFSLIHVDLTMLSVCNGREREAFDWENVFHEADTRFSEPKIQVTVGDGYAITESTWS